MTFEDLYKIVEESSHETAFNPGEVQALYQYALEMTEKSVVVEIGVEYGRSTTVLAEAQKEIGFDFHAIDGWVQDNGREAKAHVESQILKHSWNFNLISEKSEEAHSSLLSQFPNLEISLLHIDGDHEYEGVLKDIQLWVPLLKSGGYVCFDDYGHDSLPGVFKAVTEYTSTVGGFEFVGRFGKKLGVFKKL